MPRPWPTPLLQPNPHEGCFLYSMAHLCHCLDHPDVTPEQIRDFRAQEHKWEGMFALTHLGVAMERAWNHRDDRPEWQRYWLGPDTREWVESHLTGGQIAVVIVERVPYKAHALVLLESRGDEGVLVMDPLYGHRIETWEWFLSIGPGNHGCHHIDGWFSL